MKYNTWMLLILFIVLYACKPSMGIIRFDNTAPQSRYIAPASITIVEDKKVTTIKRKLTRDEFNDLGQRYENCRWIFEKKASGIHYHINCNK